MVKRDINLLKVAKRQIVEEQFNNFSQWMERNGYGEKNRQCRCRR